MTDLPITHCRSCEAEIIWTITEAGKRMCIDARPVNDGKAALRLFPATDSSINPLGHPLAGRVAHVKSVGATKDLFDQTDTGDRYVSHFATCPQADQWRGGEPSPATPGPTRHRTMHRSF